MAFVGLDIDATEVAGILGMLGHTMIPTQETLAEIADLAALLILRRTEAGRDARGLPFVPYSEPYADHREERGRVTNRVTLSFTGQMAAAVTTGTGRDHARVYFSNASAGALAEYHDKGTRTGLPQREWFQLYPGTREHSRVAQVAADLIAEQINRKVRGGR